MEKDLLTENEVIEAVTNYLKNKGRTEVKQVIHKSDASQ